MGRGCFDSVVQLVSGSALPWDRFDAEAELLVAATAPVFWSFFMLSGIALIIFRYRQEGLEILMRPIRFLLLPGIFILTCIWMLYSSIDYAGWLVMLAVVPLLAGLPLYFIIRRWPSSSAC